MAKYLTNDKGKRTGVQMSVRDYAAMKRKIAALELENEMLTFLLPITKVIMVMPQRESILHPN